jgi:hypothetical protein
LTVALASRSNPRFIQVLNFQRKFTAGLPALSHRRL